MSWINKYTPLGWLMSGYGKLFKWLDGKTGFSGKANSVGSSFASALQPYFSNLSKYYAHNGATDQFKEEADINYQHSLALQQNSQEWNEYMYNQYYSIPAQMQQYQDAGVNPMIAFGNGAGVVSAGGASGGSASPGSNSGGDPLGMIGGLLSAAMNIKQIQNQKEIADERNEISRYEAETRRKQSDDYIKYLQSLTRGNNQNIAFQAELFPLSKESLQAQTNLALAKINTEEGKLALMQSQIDVNDAEWCIKVHQSSILAAQEKYADEYFSAVKALSYYQSRIAQTTSEFERRTLERRIQGVTASVNDMIITAGIHAKDFESYGSKRVESWINTGADALRAIGSVGTMFAGMNLLGNAGQPTLLNVPQANVKLPTIQLPYDLGVPKSPEYHF